MIEFDVEFDLKFTSYVTEYLIGNYIIRMNFLT